MKICIIAEGSYPYVIGGVSSWIQTLVSSMPEHEFIIYSIGANGEDRGAYKYQLPDNIVEIQEVFLDSCLEEPSRPGKKYKLNEKQKIVIKSLLLKEKPEWEHIFSLFSGRNLEIDHVSNLLASRDLFDIIQEVCREHYPDVPFTQFYWSVRSMLLTLFGVLHQPIPEADLYHSVSTGYAGVIGAYGKYLHNKPFILTEHGIYTREREEEIIKADWVKGPFKRMWIQYFYNLSGCAYSYADQVITLFNKNKEIEIDIGCPENKIQIIPNGVDIELHPRQSAKIKKDGSHIYIGAIVRVVPIKDIKTMLQSYAIVKRQLPNTKFYIFGPYDEDPEYYKECLQLVDFLGIQDVFFTGTVKINEYIGLMDILVLSSISEGQPLALLEGMAYGKPFVCTDVGCCKELIYGINDGFGSAGYIVPVMNYMKMSQSIIKLSLEPELRKSMGKRGQKRVETLYTKEGFIEQYKKVYENRGYLNGRYWISTKKVNG